MMRDGNNAAPWTILEEFTEERVSLSVHDASRLAWNVTVPVAKSGRLTYELTVELEVPTNLVGSFEPWGALQSYARLDGADERGTQPHGSPAVFRREIMGVSFKLARSRNGFVRHCTLVRSSARARSVEEADHVQSLILWISAARGALAQARAGMLACGCKREERDNEHTLADEFLSVQLWSVLTDCARALFETQRWLAIRSEDAAAELDAVEERLSEALREEIAYRKEAKFPHAEPADALELERLVSRLRWLKKHFERVLFLEGESYRVASRLGSWFSAAAAMLAYLWFFFWQLALEKHPFPGAIGSGVLVFALLTAIVYASRERLKEAGRNWLEGRAQSMFAQRVTRYRLPSPTPRARGPIVGTARESFSQSAARRPDPVSPESQATLDVTVLRFSHRGFVTRPEAAEGSAQVRLVFRLDLSPLLPRLHDAVRGFASPNVETGHIVILDVPRNYELPVRADLRFEETHEEIERTLVLNKNGLCRIDEAAP
ncbi:hypothetical protein LZC95_28790 [Pendulispora brunnea]|uniref:Uncharacterized protein n=1 Tax=Pendulispora brunnea TaxID=2905690 RepID=A0ABZ2JVP0_9BACT